MQTLLKDTLVSCLHGYNSSASGTHFHNQLKRFPLLKCVVQFTFSSFPSYCCPGYSLIYLKFHILISSPNTSEQLNRDGEKHHHIKLVSPRTCTLSSAQLYPQENLLQWTYWLRATAGSTYRPSLGCTQAGLPWDFFQPVTGSGKTTLAELFLPNVDSPNSQPLLGDLTLAWSRHSQIFTQSHALLPSFTSPFRFTGVKPAITSKDSPLYA